MATQLAICDTYWNTIDQQFGGFPYPTVNWDSMKNLYRPAVAAGVSRGRLDAIMCQLYADLTQGLTGRVQGSMRRRVFLRYRRTRRPADLWNDMHNDILPHDE
jgi:hypothetical protein